MVAELAGLFERRVAHAGRQAPEPSGALEECGGFEGDHLQVLVDRHVDALFELQVDHLAAAEGEHRLGKQGKRWSRAVGVPGRQQVDDRARDERLQCGTGVDRLAHAPDLPDRGPTAAQLVAVLNVVEDQREIVHQLDGDGRPQRVRVALTKGFAGEQGDIRPQPLAGALAGLAQPEVVLDHLGEQ